MSSKVRPTTDKLRSSVFSIIGDEIEGAKVLDAFAGTGSFGFESYSRGASHVTFLDVDTLAVKANIKLFPKNFSYYIKKEDFFKSFKDVGFPFDIIFMDPPYGIYDPAKVLTSLYNKKILKECGVVVYEEFFKTPFDITDLFMSRDERRYGDTIVRFLELNK